MTACGRNSESIFEQLIGAGVVIEARSTSGPRLHEAAGGNFSEAIRRLLMAGADPNQMVELGRTPKQISEQGGFEESVSSFKTARSGE
jgi:hypothetical protein